MTGLDDLYLTRNDVSENFRNLNIQGKNQIIQSVLYDSIDILLDINNTLNTYQST